MDDDALPISALSHLIRCEGGRRARLCTGAKTCKSLGVRVQPFVFACSFGGKERVQLRAALMAIRDAENGEGPSSPRAR